MHCALFVFGAIAANVELIEYIEDLEICAAGVAEQALHAFGAQRRRQYLCAALGLRAILWANRGQRPARYRGNIAIGDVVRGWSGGILRHAGL